MAKILVLCAANPALNPRPNRMIKLLQNNHKVSAMGIHTSPIEGVETFSYPAYKKRNLLEEFRLYVDVFFSRWQNLIYTYNRLEIIKVLKSHSFDIIICHDLVLLPIVLRYKRNTKILFDAREFYPAQNTTNLRWRLLFARFNHYLCKTYLHHCDAIITVSEGLKNRYKKDYGVDCRLFLSLPDSHNIIPKTTNPNDIRLIYHGAASPNRKIQNTIKIIDYLEPRFSLDLMLVNTNEAYMQYLKKIVHKKQLQGKKIRIIPPVSFSDIIPFSSLYDIGLYHIAPSTFNLKYALPNKFFEYIQATLALAITPNAELIPFVKKHNNGIISKDFTPASIAETINTLDKNAIETFKKNSQQAAKILNINSNQALLDEIITEILK